MSNLEIDADRLWESLHGIAKIGGLPNGGVARLCLTEDDRIVRDWLTQQCAALGMTMTVDEVGNMFARREGTVPGLSPIAMGSHLDSQPTGGKFDGALGVLAGLEVLRTLHDAGLTTRSPLILLNWTNEEGSRFTPAMLGSAVHAGVVTRDNADDRLDPKGIRFGDALETIGYRGAAKAGSTTLGALFELHIEQGPMLEAQGRQIGIVLGVQGLHWLSVEFTGQAAHTGSTPMTMRRNAMLGAARLIEAVNSVALDYAPSAVGTVGFVEVSPNSNNVIPGHVKLLIDLRHPDDDVLARIDASVRTAADLIADAVGLEVDIAIVAETPAAVFDPQCIASVRQAVRKSAFSAMDIVSGAGHDAVHISRHVPTTMIFVPSKDGLSHNHAEFTSQSECAAGTQVLLDAVLDYDRRVAEDFRAG